MGVFGIDTFRERSLIPPDEPDMVTVESSEHLRRRVTKDGIGWFRLPHDLVGYDEDCWEEAYEMGRKSMRAELEGR